MKKVLPIVLSLVLLTASLTACGSKTDEPTTPATTGTETTTGGEETTTGGEETTPENEIDISEHVTIKMYFHGSNVTDDVAVLEAINQYVGEKLNMTFEPIWGTWGDFDNNAVLAINGGDDVDIYFTCSWSADEYNAFAKKGAWVRLDDPENDLLAKYGSALWEVLPAVLQQGATIEGSDGKGVYAIPGYKDIATQNCWDVNVTLLEKYGYTVDDIKGKSYYEFGEILETVKAGEGKNFYPLLIEGAVLERMVTNSIIVTGDSGSVNFLSYYIDPTNPANDSPAGNVIYNKFATDEYKKFVEKTREYYLAGYIDPAMGIADQANDVRTSKQLSGEYLIGTQSYALGYEFEASALRGIEVAMVPCTPAYVDTSSSQGALMAISTASKNPDRAMMFLSLLNTDPYLMTLLAYGVEGVHYNTNADGTIAFTAERDNYSPWRNGIGNVTLLPATEDEGVGFWDGFKAYYGAASSIPILGFTFDAKPVENEMGTLANIAAEYTTALNAGTVDPAVKLPEFLDKLEKAGMQKYVDEANAQLEAFLNAE